MDSDRFGDNPRGIVDNPGGDTVSDVSAASKVLPGGGEALLPRAKKASLARVKLVAVGPWMVTADEFGSPDAVDIELSVNGEGIGRMVVEVRDA